MRSRHSLRRAYRSANHPQLPSFRRKSRARDARARKVGRSCPADVAAASALAASGSLRSLPSTRRRSPPRTSKTRTRSHLTAFGKRTGGLPKMEDALLIRPGREIPPQDRVIGGVLWAGLLPPNVLDCVFAAIAASPMSDRDQWTAWITPPPARNPCEFRPIVIEFYLQLSLPSSSMPHSAIAPRCEWNPARESASQSSALPRRGVFSIETGLDRTVPVPSRPSCGFKIRTRPRPRALRLAQDYSVHGAVATARVR